MNNLLTAITTQISGSTFSTDVGGRAYLDEYPADEMPATYPYMIYSIVSGNPDDVFAKKGEDILIQFSLFSASAGATEITTMYADLRTLFDDCSMTIYGSNLIWMRWQGLTTMIDEIMVKDATQTVTHWAVDYEIMTQES
jgi:hypothetical protein